MNEKQKAKELVDRFYKGNEHIICFANAVKCALICVQEIIETFIEIDPKLKYWQEVKKEIENM